MDDSWCDIVRNRKLIGLGNVHRDLQQKTKQNTYLILTKLCTKSAGFIRRGRRNVPTLSIKWAHASVGWFVDSWFDCGCWFNFPNWFPPTNAPSAAVLTVSLAENNFRALHFHRLPKSQLVSYHLQAGCHLTGRERWMWGRGGGRGAKKIGSHYRLD